MFAKRYLRLRRKGWRKALWQKERKGWRSGRETMCWGPALIQRKGLSHLCLIITQFVVLKHLLLELSANRNPLKLIFCWERQSRGGSQDGTDRRDARGLRVWYLGQIFTKLFFLFPFVNFFNFQFTFTFSHLGWGFGEKLVGWPFHVC